MRRFVYLLLGFLTISPVLIADSPRIVAQTGHVDSISHIAVHEADGTLISISHDGSLRVWDTKSHTLQFKLQVSPLPLLNLALHPTAPRAAIIESDGISIHRLSVWDWSTGRRIFSRDLDTIPLYLSFSPKGTFLAYSIADWQSITVVDAKTGGQLPYIRSGFGIVSGFRISSSEQKVLAYLPSGSIQYRNLRSGTLIQEFPTIADIENPEFIMGNRYMIGKWENTLVAIDLLSGQDVASIRTPNLLAFSTNEATSDVLCLFGPSAQKEVASFVSYSFTGGAFRSKYSRYAPPENLSANHVVSRGTVYTGTREGRLFYQTSFSNAPRLLAENRLSTIIDFESSSGILLSTVNSIVTIYADYLYQDDQRSQSDRVLTHIQANPLHAEAKISSIGNDTYLLRDSSGERGRYWIFSPVEGAIGLPNNRYQAPILSTDTKNQRVLTIDEEGRIQIFNLLNGTFEFDMQLFGLQTAIFVHGDNIVASGRRSMSLRVSTLLINTGTGETVPFDNDNLDTFQLAYDPLSHTLYSLSIAGSATSPRTVLTEHSGLVFENSRTLFSMAGAHTDATMSVNRGTLFLSSGGVNRALYAGTSRLMPVDSNDNIPVKVEVMENWLIGLNRDSSLSVWNRATGAHALDFYLFNDLQWVAVTATGAVVSSSAGTDLYITKY